MSPLSSANGFTDSAVKTEGDTPGHAVWRAIEASQRHCAAWSAIKKDDVVNSYNQFKATETAGVGPLGGLAFGVKDNIDVAGLPSTCGSPLYSDYVPRFDASCVSLLRQAGAIPVGKTVTTEFAYKQEGPTTNPWNTAHTPGGSSSGSAAAVACGVVAFALGTQTGGSITRPAAYCGVLGFKPTPGLVHRGGLRLLSDTLDTIGWFARSMTEVRLVADVLLPSAERGSVKTYGPDQAMSIAVIRAESLAELDPCGENSINDATNKLIEAGVDAYELDANDLMLELKQCHWTIMAYEMARGLHAEYRANPSALSSKLIATLEAGSAIDGHRYQEALRQVGVLEQTLLDKLGDADFILTPSAPGIAPRGLTNTGESIFNRVWSALGWPALHVPTRYDTTGLPLGVQLVGRANADHRLLAAASWIHPLIDCRAGVTIANCGP